MKKNIRSEKSPSNKISNSIPKIELPSPPMVITQPIVDIAFLFLKKFEKLTKKERSTIIDVINHSFPPMIKIKLAKPK